MGSDGVIAAISALDHLFVPIKADRLVLESTLNFATTINDRLIKTGVSALKSLHLFWNMVDRRERTTLYDVYQQGFSLLGLDCLKHAFPCAATSQRTCPLRAAPFTGVRSSLPMRHSPKNAVSIRLWMRSYLYLKPNSHGEENKRTKSGG